jgi:alpha-L-rhamnosidase-like protein
MDSYRCCQHEANRGKKTQTIEARLNQYSQRYQKISLVLPNTSLTFSAIGFRKVRPGTVVKSTFSCSDPLLNSIWRDGVRTLDMCTVRQGETRPAWDVTPEGTRVYGSHWAPCRKGTAWTNKTVTFAARIEKGGASWGVHMVANGLVLCLDAETRILSAVEGLSNTSSLLPVVPRGSWPVPPVVDLSDWFSVRTVVHGESVKVLIGDETVAEIVDVRIRPLLSGERVNTGSVAFGGPEGWITTYKALRVTDPNDKVLYENSMLIADTDAVHADFQVGSNPLACTVDGAKRDRACFGGDVFVMGPSLAYSTADFEAWKGSIELLASHQNANGYLGNLCPIQTPKHEGDDEPPSYAFYSLTYALLLVVSVKDYWMHSGDWDTVERCYPKLEKLVRFAETFANSDGLLEAPPGLQSQSWPHAQHILFLLTFLDSDVVPNGRTCHRRVLWRERCILRRVGEHGKDVPQRPRAALVSVKSKRAERRNLQAPLELGDGHPAFREFSSPGWFLPGH